MKNCRQDQITGGDLPLIRQLAQHEKKVMPSSGSNSFQLAANGYVEVLNPQAAHGGQLIILKVINMDVESIRKRTCH